MKLRFSHFRDSSRSTRSGVALIITIIMLSVITFLAVAFLALSGREKGSVKTATNQFTAKQGAEAGLERVKVELIAGMLATTNSANFGFMVSTNYINYAGYQTGSVLDQTTNVSYTYANGNPISLADSHQLLENLLYSPRPPVFITNRLFANSNEFRYYLDLNRNGRHDLSGIHPVISDNPALPYYNTNGVAMPNIIFGNTLSNSVQGDPEWIGILDRPNLPHGPENRFAARIAYAVVPIGKTLDVNYIHNQALAASSGTMDANGHNFFRNQGVGAWEINLAAFLSDLNTNTYAWGGLLGYSYDPAYGLPEGGIAFEDAGGIYRYRVNGNTGNYNYNGLESLNAFYNGSADAAFQGDLVDGYTDSSLLTTNGVKMPASGFLTDNDIPSRPWVGADHPFHLFSTQDFFDRNKIAATGGGLKFMDRLASLGTNNSTYDQYTFYRLLDQLGTDSAPEDTSRLNLNYVNVDGYPLTNFLRWEDPNFPFVSRFGVPGSVLFFTNVVDRLLRSYTTEWLQADYANYTNTFKVDQPFGVTGIPVSVNGQMAYAPAVQRVLQMAANMWDAKTNRHDLDGPLPTVFAPRFIVSSNSVYITNYVEVFTTNDLSLLPPLDLTLIPSNSLSTATVPADSLVFGVPLVIGARKGLPNFNEYAMDATFTVERKLELIKSGAGDQSAISQTNQLYTINLKVGCGAEFWNSYKTNYTRPVNVFADNLISISLTDSNYPTGSPGSPFTKNVSSSGFTNTAAGTPWPAWTGEEQDVSFFVPFRTNISLFVPATIGYWPGASSFVSVSATTPPYEVDSRLLMPHWNLAITNRVQAIITDRNTGRIIDYVLLGDMNYRTNLVTMFGQTPISRGFTGVWATNAVGTQISGRPGVVQQILISMGNGPTFAAGNIPSDWEYQYGTFSANRAYEIAKFGAFFLPSGSSGSFTDPATGEFASTVNNSNRAYTPFNPSVTYTVPMSWQANDPLVHYIGRDMLDIKSSFIPYRIKPTGNNNTNAMANIGLKNNRYQPWGNSKGDLASDPDAFNASIKDPLVRRSDDWQFPTNALPTLGWLGRIHRGTPWQTIYLKSSNVGITNLVSTPTAWAVNFKKQSDKWAKWTGNRSLEEGFYSRPVMDRLLFDEFTTELSENASRGRLPINQTGLAAWSALFSGMVVLTNDATEVQLALNTRQFSPLIIQPAGAYDAFDATTWPPLVRLVNGINLRRSNTNYFANGSFQHLGDILAVPELTDESPFLNRSTETAKYRGLNDAAYEWLPQQMMSLVQLGTPRFVVYSYGQALQPAPDSIIPNGTYAGLCTNYAITAEVALRAVVKVVGSPDPARTNSFLPAEKQYPPRVVIESFNYLAPE